MRAGDRLDDREAKSGAVAAPGGGSPRLKRSKARPMNSGAKPGPAILDVDSHVLLALAGARTVISPPPCWMAFSTRFVSA